MKRRDLKILWSSNAHWSGSGYGIFSGQLLKRLHADGWKVAEQAFYGLEGNMATIDGIPVYPRVGDVWGSEGLVHHSRHFGADVTLTMQDQWSLNPNSLANVKNWIPYTPIDKDPVPPGVTSNLRYAYRILTFSKFGQKSLSKGGFTSKLILEGTDTELFKPMDQAQARKDLNLPPEAFLFGMVAANKENPPRKGFQQAMEAFKLFYDKHPEAALMIHVQQPSPSGFPLELYARHLGIEGRIFFPDPYLAVNQALSETINKEYNAFDVLLHPSSTEGFGLTVVEAQSAGTPAIIQDCHSMPELIIPGETGWQARTAWNWFTNDGSFWHIADVNSIYNAMEASYVALKNDRAGVAKKCRDNIVTNFNIDTQFKEQWVTFFEGLQEELLPVKV